MLRIEFKTDVMSIRIYRRDDTGTRTHTSIENDIARATIRVNQFLQQLDWFFVRMQQLVRVYTLMSHNVDGTFPRKTEIFSAPVNDTLVSTPRSTFQITHTVNDFVPNDDGFRFHAVITHRVDESLLNVPSRE